MEDYVNWTPGNPNDRSVTGFRIRHGSSRGPMSRKFYNDLKKRGLAPRETHVNGRISITPEAEAEWDRARSNPTTTEARLNSKLRKFRHERAVRAGRAAAASPRHISKQGKRQ